MSNKSFSELGISAEILKAVDRLGFEQASPIQAESIPLLLAGRDIVGQSQTGSGKTAAFGIPAIEKVDTQNRAVQVLILCPTRELAVQVSEELHKLAFFKRGIHALPIYGGQSYDRQIYGLKQGAQIVIGTPGRLMDHMRRGTLRLEQVRFVVLDEADVMLDMGFREDIEFILKAVPAQRQTVFFSATMPVAIRELISRNSREPQEVRIEQKAMTVPTVEQTYYEVDRRFKVELLTRLIDIHDLKLGIIFCNTKRMVDELVEHLNAQGYSADRLHGDMSQALRDRVMNRFRKSGLEFLVATDVAARGIDVNDVQVVFNYDLPYDVEDYVHRIGRTGRAGRSGRAISFVAGREVFQIRNIERYTRTRIHHAKIPTATEVEQARTSVFLDNLRALLQSGEFKPQNHILEVLLEEGFASTDIAFALIHQLQSQSGREEEVEKSQSNRMGGERDRGEPGPRRMNPTRNERSDERPQGNRLPAKGDRFGSKSASERASALPSRVPVQRPSAASPEAPVGFAPSETPAASVPAAPAEIPIAAERRAPVHASVSKLGRQSRRTPEGQTRLHMSIGSENGVTGEDIHRVIQGETGLPSAALGHVDLRERHAFVDVAAEHAQAVVSKLKRSLLAGRRLKVKLAESPSEE